ncbi:MAG TPA: hypothetical protein VE445_13345 [Nitrososphaeraceae archaeon]|nr:hypothetical protein [Nitrososphaeraceae archaeon]
MVGPVQVQTLQQQWKLTVLLLVSLLLHTCCLNHHHSFEECLGHDLNANLGQEARGGYLW